MSDEIKVGDLVMVVRPAKCCPSDYLLGAIFQVKTVNNLLTVCCGCDKELQGPFALDGELERSFKRGNLPRAYPFSRLKRIPPLEDLQSYRHTDENPVKVVT